MVTLDHDRPRQQGSSEAFTLIVPSGATARRERKRPNTYAPAYEIRSHSIGTARDFRDARVCQESAAVPGEPADEPSAR